MFIELVWIDWINSFSIKIVYYFSIGVNLKLVKLLEKWKYYVIV